MKDVAAQQQRGWIVRLIRLETGGRLLSDLVKAGVVREAGAGDEPISQLFGRTCRCVFVAQVLLQRGDVAIRSRVGGQCDGARPGVGRRRLRRGAITRPRG